MLLKILFLLNIFLNLLVFSIPSPNCQWDLSNPSKNVLKFAQFMDEIFMDYNKKNEESDSPFSEWKKRTVFHLTFVKWASELAHFHLINDSNNNNNNSEKQFRNLNLDSKYTKQHNVFLHYDQSLGHQIANKFKNEFSPCEKQQIESQILQLTFSLAARILLSLIYGTYFTNNDIGGWQLKNILFAYKKISSKSDNNEIGIFPFRIIQIEANGQHLWAQFLSPADQNWKEFNSEQLQYIENFKFIVKLSEFTLTNNEIFKIHEAIINDTNDNGQDNMPLIYTFIREHFALKLSSQKRKMDCALVSFGRELAHRYVLKYHSFTEFANANEIKCGKDPRKWNWNGDNTPENGSNLIEMELFHEPLWSYAKVIKIDENEFKAVRKAYDELKKVIISSLHSSSPENEGIIMAFTKRVEFKFFFQILRSLNYFPYTGTAKKMTSFVIEYDGKLTICEKKSLLNAFLALLDQIIGHYKISEYELMDDDQQVKLNYLTDNVFKFGQFLFQIFKKHSENVKYDERQQLLTVPLQFCEQFIGRLSLFLQRNLTANNQFKIMEMNFLKTIQIIASAENKLISEKCPSYINKESNNDFFKLLITLALRLGLIIGSNEFAEQYLPALLSQLELRPKNNNDKYIYDYNMFNYKIKVVNNVVQINMPNWNLPYFVFLDDPNELIDQESNELLVYEHHSKQKCFVTQDYKFDKALPKCDPITLYELIKMTKIIVEMQNDQIWISPNDPEILKIIVKFLNYFDIEKTITERMAFSAEGNYCILAQFVMDLLETANGANYLPDIDIIEIFVVQTKEWCTDKRINDEIGKNNHGKKIMEITGNIKINYHLQNDITRIILPNLIDHLKEMIKNEDWHFANLSDVKMIEWNLLKLAFYKNDQGKKWKEIEEKLTEWKKEFLNSFQNERNNSKFQKMLQQLEEKLEKFEKAVTEKKKSVWTKIVEKLSEIFD